MANDCYGCGRTFSDSRPRVTTTPPTCKACWLVSSDAPPPNEFDDSERTPTDPYIVPVFGRFSVED